MTNYLPAIDRGRWAENQVYSGNHDSTATIDPESGPPNRFVGINHVRPIITASPMYAAKCRKYSGGPTAFARPFNDNLTSWEPDNYCGKPGTILTKPKAAIVFDCKGFHAADAPAHTGIVAACGSIAAAANALGVHLYYCADAGRSATHFLTFGKPHGGRTFGAYDPSVDYSFGYTQPAAWGTGDLLVIHLNAQPVGFIDLFSRFFSTYNSFTGVLRTQWICGDYVGGSIPDGYHGFSTDPTTNNVIACTSASAIGNDRAYHQAFMARRGVRDRFRHVLHVQDSPTVSKTYGANAAPVGSPPVGYPGDTVAVFNAVTAGLDGFQVGATIDPFGSTSAVASILLNDITAFFS